MSENGLGLIELIGVFGVVLAFLVWQLVKTRRGLKQSQEREKDRR